MKYDTYWFLLLICSVLLYLLYVNRKHLGIWREGMTTGSQAQTAGQAKQFATDVSDRVTQMKNSLAISTYRTDYENLIMYMDDYLNASILQSAMAINMDSPETEIENIALYNKSKIAMESIMQFLDKN